MRTNITQLPSSEELKELLEKEEKRPVPEENRLVHWPRFETIKELLAHYGLDGSLFDATLSEAEVYSQNFMEQSQKLTDALSERILADQHKPLQILSNIFDYLSEEDSLHPCDVMLVLGNHRSERIEKCIALYKQGYAPIIMLSGNRPFYQTDDVPEAFVYKQFALDQGVPEEAILTESGSFTIPDNIRRSLNILDAKPIQYKSILLVNSPYTQRRAWCHLKKYLPSTVQIVRVSALPSPGFSKETWFVDEYNLKAVLNEFPKMKLSMLLNTA
jgi:hypothetical protein